MLKIFQDFYSLTGRLPLSNSQLVVPDKDAPPEEKLNMRHLYDLFKNTILIGPSPIKLYRYFNLKIRKICSLNK